MNNTIQQNTNIWTIVIFVIVGIIVLFVIRKKLKILKIPCVFFIDGAPKTGKSALTIHLGIKTYLKNVFAWLLGKVFYWLRHHNLLGYPLKPMLYCNIPLAFKHNRLTKDIILRKVRIPNKSVVIIDEASLVADSMLFKDQVTNYQILMFAKLFGHYSHGGTLLLNSHTITDLHYAFKRSLGTYLYIYQSNKFPFVTLCKCREMVYSDNNNMVNDISADAELSMRTMFYFNWVYKLYDCFCYSCFTDDLSYQVDYNYKYDKKDLKCRNIVSFNKDISKMECEEK